MLTFFDLSHVLFVSFSVSEIDDDSNDQQNYESDHQ
jgi:hypothetical protein